MRRSAAVGSSLLRSAGKGRYGRPPFPPPALPVVRGDRCPGLRTCFRSPSGSQRAEGPVSARPSSPSAPHDHVAESPPQRILSPGADHRRLVKGAVVIDGVPPDERPENPLLFRVGRRKQPPPQDRRVFRIPRHVIDLLPDPHEEG